MQKNRNEYWAWHLTPLRVYRLWILCLLNVLILYFARRKFMEQEQCSTYGYDYEFSFYSIFNVKQDIDRVLSWTFNGPRSENVKFRQLTNRAHP